MLTAEEIVSNLGTMLREHRRGATQRYRGVCIDSRAARPGDLFVALRGEQRDGHEFVADAVERGATGLLVSRAVDAPPGVSVFRARDTLAALQRLGTARRERTGVTVVAVTGSVGKTMTKELAAAVLGAKHPTLKSRGNYNTEIGVPLTLLELTTRHRRAVLEFAMRGPGQIAELCEIARPDIGVVTNVGVTHMEQLGSREAIAREKGALVEHLAPDGVAVLNADDRRVRAMRRRTRARVLTFGLASDADVRATGVESRGLRGVSFRLQWEGRSRAVRLPLPGRHNVSNALAAAAVGLADGMTAAEVADALARAEVEGRIGVLRGRNGSTVIDDTYNASPASMAAALDLLAETRAKRRIALLGDMKELGAAERRGHREVGRHAAEAVDVLHTTGELGRLIAEAARRAGATVSHWPTKEEAATAIAGDLRRGDVVLVKASRAMAFETVLPLLEEGRR